MRHRPGRHHHLHAVPCLQEKGGSTLIPHRVYIASPDALFFEKSLLQEPAFLLAGSSTSGLQAHFEILSLSPDLLILDSALSALDGLSVMAQLQKEMPAPPRILFLCRSSDSGWQKIAREAGADQALLWPEEKEGWIAHALSCAESPLPALARNTREERAFLSLALLKQLGVSEKLKGFSYLHEAVSALACAPQLGASLSQRLYPYLAHSFSVTPHAVERACRTAVEHTWLHGHLPAIQSLFGFSVDADRGKPTNAEFFSMLAEHVRREMIKKRRMK